MAAQAVLFGTILFLLGPIFYLLGEPGSRSFTAFIPSVIGALIAVCGVIAKNPARRKAAMHGAAGLGLLGILGSLRSASQWPRILSGQAVERPLAVWEQLLMFVICLVFVAACARSFSAARRAA
jgi:hypothetical protein